MTHSLLKIFGVQGHTLLCTSLRIDSTTMTFVFPRRASCGGEMPTHQQEMLKACETGDIGKLKELFSAADVLALNTPTERGIDPIPRSGPPATSDLLHSAVTHNHPEILQFLLRTYPSASVASDVLLGSRYANPDLSTLKVLHSHDLSIVNYTMQQADGLDYLLLDYCRDGDPQLAGYLLDNGADPNVEGLPLLNFCPLQIAINSGQPPSLIYKLIGCGAKVRVMEVTYAIQKQRMDILELLLSHCQWRAYMRSPRKNMNIALRKAYETETMELIALVENHIKKEKKQMSCWQFWN